MAERQNTTIEIIKRFLGRSKMLESDVLKNKAREWIYAQWNKEGNGTRRKYLFVSFVEVA